MDEAEYEQKLDKLIARLVAKLDYARSSDSAVIQNDISYIKTDICEIKIKLDGHYVTKEEFEPIKRVVYGAVGASLISLVGAILALVYRL